MKIFVKALKSGLLLLVIFLLPGLIFAQVEDFNKKLPVDEDVVIGRLENGFTYYIRKNKKPEKRVELRLIVNAGSILEAEDQLGIAHFIEHMAFNGTLNFAKNELIDYLESVGIQFGPEINAYTSFDETVYMLSLPTDSLEILKNGMQVMEDWAHNMTLDPEEIDKERGVIIEEWRIGQGAFERMRKKIIPVIFSNSRYAERLPIGKKEIIESAPYEVLTRFYRDWYRPDLMAFIAVGDIDIEQMEDWIKNHFSNLVIPSDAPVREEYDVPIQEKTRAVVATDREAPVTRLSLFYRHEPGKVETFGDYRQQIINSMVTGMLNQRLENLKEQADPPFINAAAYHGELWVRTTAAFQMYALVDEKKIETALEVLVSEAERIKQFGFTEGELGRFKSIFMNRYQQIYNEKDKTESTSFTREYVNNFLKDEPIPGIDFEYGFAKMVLPGITLAEINETARQFITDNKLVVVESPEKEDLDIPDEDKLLTIVEETTKKELYPYSEDKVAENLMNELPEPGKLKKTKEISEAGITLLTFSNGVNVYLKPTNFKNDEILMSAYSFGGTSLYSDELYPSASHAAAIMNESGVNGFTNSDLRKMMAGRTVSVSPAISSYSEGLSGKSAPKDFETMLQLTRLYFVAPRKDQESFDSYITKQRSYYQNMLSLPEQYFFNEYVKIRTQDHPRANDFPTEKDWENLNLEQVHRIYRERFADGNDFTFFFAGAFAVDTLVPYLERYLGSLPVLKGKEDFREISIDIPVGITDSTIRKGTDSKSIVLLYFEKKAEWNEKDAHLFSTLGGILSRKYIEVLREEMSSVYGAGASSGITKIPSGEAYMQIYIPCSPDNADKLTEAAINEIRVIMNEGPSDEDITKAKEIQRREGEKNAETNSYWLNRMVSASKNSSDMSEAGNYQKYINNISREEIKRVANEYLDMNHYLRVVLMPENAE
ncbi:MAG: M16 family metallopeptidase [Bacteroidota bacterium]